METLHTRLDYQKEEVIRVVKTFGPFRAMNKFGVATYDCFERWYREVTGGETFPISPKIRLGCDQTLGDQLVDAFLHKVARLQTENEKLRERIEFLEWQLSIKGEREQDQALAVLEVCRA